jgi:hypothetical protein
MLHGVASRRVACCALAVIFALYIVGYVSHGVLRHIVQTAPLWIIVIAGFGNSDLTKWVALPCFVLWLVLMSLIWLFLLGIAHVISGTFSPIEVAMTLEVGTAVIAGIVTALRWKTKVTAMVSTALFIGVLALQVLALRISFLPGISHD